eukprot:scaffold1.g5826.t1
MHLQQAPCTSDRAIVRGTRVHCCRSAPAAAEARLRGHSSAARPPARPAPRVRLAHIASSAFRENPQNVDQPLVLPSPTLSAEEAVRVQLDALAQNDAPWANHGLQTAYEWALDVGGLDPSHYFGFRKDLYHFDHFMGMFQSRLPELVNLSSYEITGVAEAGDGATVVSVAVVGPRPGLAGEFEFHLRRKAVGGKKGSLMTHMLRRTDGG